MSSSVHIIDDTAPAACMLSELRVRILRALREPNSAAGIAQEMGVPRQKLNYHIRQLQDHGLVKPAGSRQARGFTERLVRATASAYLISPSALGAVGADPDAIQDRASSSYLASTAAAVISDVSLLRTQADVSGKRLATLAMTSEVRFQSPADQHAFAERLAACTAALIFEYHTDGGRAFKLFTGLYQAPG